MLAVVTPSEEERTAGALSSGTIERAARHFRVDGALILQDVVTRALILKARNAFDAAYARYLDGNQHSDALQVGDKRLMITVNLEPPFDAPGLFANPWLLPILGAALDEDFMVGAFGVVCSLPEAPTQHRHSDGGILFPRAGVDSLLPSTAITVAIPLLEMNEINGTTTLWPGSHRHANGGMDAEAIEPVVREGSLVLWDFRLNSGTPNRSGVVRPLLYLTYCRPWWVDHGNFRKKTLTPLRARKASLSELSEQHRRLLARAEEF